MKEIKNKEKKQNRKGGVLSKEMVFAIRDLRKRRWELIEIEMKMERGLGGRLRRLGLGKRESYPGYSRARTSYLVALGNFRREVIKKFRQDRRSLFRAKLLTIYRMTVTDEIQRFKLEKEGLRRRGIRGFFREKAQDYREVNPRFKMGAGLALIVASMSFLVFEVQEFLVWQEVVMTLGIIISFEGIQQEFTIRKGIRLGLTRAQALRKAKRSLGDDTKKLGEKLRRIHIELEEEIWKIRQFEKRGEYRRYLIAVLGGAVLGAALVWPRGMINALTNFILAGSAHLFLYLLLPFGLIGSLIWERENEYYVKEEYPEETRWMIGL